MISAFFLALGQLADPRVLRVLLKSLGVTLLAFAVLGTAGWWALDAGLTAAGIDNAWFDAADGLRGLIALAGVLLGGWLLWRVLALAVLQFFADEVVEAVEARHYPAALASARRLGWHEELRGGLKSGARALLVNLIALPFALMLIVTGVGPALVFWLANAVLLGRELMDMVWLRHRHAADAPPPLSPRERFALGGIAAALLLVPVVNLLAPILGAAMAAHLIHRKRTLPNAA
jgi:uncharacterized protein involved in cysteine biosynthesis